MTKQEQDKRWACLSDNEQAKWREDYKYNVDAGAIESMKIIEELFGSHNLNPKIKTWKDVKEEYMLRADTRTSYIIDMDKKCYSEKLVLKALATIQIAKLIELGYGGVVTEEEWKDHTNFKYCVEREDNELTYTHNKIGYSFIAFHTPEQREEFMSYPKNLQLIKDYYMI